MVELIRDERVGTTTEIADVLWFFRRRNRITSITLIHCNHNVNDFTHASRLPPMKRKVDTPSVSFGVSGRVR
ncbi:hypothetical protein CETAM_00045 [Corynebacterium comes]|uniref:Uncharacterized protein n=1 Tax=Corynebacterium comes TaxID=2675218 RepID=A0A6B8VWH9_9CORY|nr:hypothetical protein CETAM_00045 [Corynebacterium comes]